MVCRALAAAFLLLEAAKGGSAESTWSFQRWGSGCRDHYLYFLLLQFTKKCPCISCASLRGSKKNLTPNNPYTGHMGQRNCQITPEGCSQLNPECGKQYGTNGLFLSTKKLQEGKKGEI